MITGCPGDSRRLRADRGLRRAHFQADRGRGRPGQQPSRRKPARARPAGAPRDRRRSRCHRPRNLAGRPLRPRPGRPLPPDAADHADRRSSWQAKSPGHILRRFTPRHVPGLAGNDAAHRVEPGAKPAHTLNRDPVVSRAGPVELTVGQPPDQRTAGQFGDRGVDLGQADAIPAGQCAAPGSRQPGSRCTSAAAIRSARTPVAAGGACGLGAGLGPRHGRRRQRRRLRRDRVVVSCGAARHGSYRRDRAGIGRDCVSAAIHRQPGPHSSSSSPARKAGNVPATPIDRHRR